MHAVHNGFFKANGFNLRRSVAVFVIQHVSKLCVHIMHVKLPHVYILIAVNTLKHTLLTDIIKDTRYKTAQSAACYISEYNNTALAVALLACATWQSMNKLVPAGHE